ncbi:DeoxyUTP pyrophosphatase domain containing protein [Aphelenchoides bicaudatus]|nr:DeoxyUTP pyrophosphatase domain containing protein [Aphelenchoides bicaudatus]
MSYFHRYCDFLSRFNLRSHFSTMSTLKNNTILFTRISENAQLPVYSSKLAAGMDIFSSESVTVPAHGKILVGTGLKMAIPTGYYGRVAPRSGLAVKNFIDVGAGVIDEDYRGELKVLLFNFSDTEFKVKTWGSHCTTLVGEDLAC